MREDPGKLKKLDFKSWADFYSHMQVRSVSAVFSSLLFPLLFDKVKSCVTSEEGHSWTHHL